MTDYTADLCTGGTPSVDSIQAGTAANIFDDNTSGAPWDSANNNNPHWFKYDFGVGVAHKIEKVRVHAGTEGYGSLDFDIEGSNNDSDWDKLLENQVFTASGWTDYTFSNSTAYRYIRFYSIDSEYIGGLLSVQECEMMAVYSKNTGVSIGSPMIFMKEVWEKRDRLFLPKKKLWTPRLV